MKLINYILETMGFESISDFIGNFSPLFIPILALTIPIASILGFIETYSGISIMFWVFMIFGAVIDLLLGVIANVFYLKQEFETQKFMRGIFKAFVLYVVVFLTNTFKMGIEHTEVRPEILEPLMYNTISTLHYTFVLLMGVFILFSIAENMAKMEIPVAKSFVKILSIKIKKLENGNKD